MPAVFSISQSKPNKKHLNLANYLRKNLTTVTAFSKLTLRPQLWGLGNTRSLPEETTDNGLGNIRVRDATKKRTCSMKKIFGVIIGVLALAGIASAEGLAYTCPTTVPEAFSTLMGTGCQIDDYQFTNFAVATNSHGSGINAIDASVPADVTATFAYGSVHNPYQVTFNLNDSESFIQDFTLTYTLTIDSNAAPATANPPGTWAIYQATPGVQDNGGNLYGGDAATWEKSVVVVTGISSPFLSETIVDVNGTTTPQGSISGISATVLDVTDTFTITNSDAGSILDLSNIYYQGVAEPSTMILLGVALIGLGVVVRKRRRACA